ncbi:hypothetical protein J7K74_00630 [Candidatus Woesearchaeota archaeon]|nr:hypothetical protein [Candidatus Woesearchaeota archaeon]
MAKQKTEKELKQPIVETRIKKSKDGKWIVFKTIITDIKPISYYEKVLE